MSEDYIHGYSGRESDRLRDQASALIELLHFNTRYPSGDLVLEAGCGVGSQTIILGKRCPGARFVAVDISLSSIRQAIGRLKDAGIENVRFQVQDANGLSFKDNSFDHVFASFLLEHMADPAATLGELRRVLKDGGTMTIIEGDHGSAFFYPDSEAARKAIDCQVKIQEEAGGDAGIGRRLHPLFRQAGFKDFSVTPRMVYADDSQPGLKETFTRKTFTAMIEGIRDLVAAGDLMDQGEFEQGIRDLYRTAEPGGVFCYTFFKAQGKK